MTVKLSISVPDDVAAFLATQGNTSAYLTVLTREKMPDARRQRQRASALAYAEAMRRRTSEQIEADRDLMDASNEISMRGAEW